MQIKTVTCLGGTSLLALAMLTGCESTEPDASAQLPVVSIMTLNPVALELTEDLPARVAAVRVAEIRPQVGGIVQRRLFEQGTEVRAGQPLFQISAAPFKAELDTAQANLQRAEVALSRARIQASRLQTLIEADAVSGQVFDDAISQRDQAAAEVAQARAILARKQLDLKFASIDAPISGRIDQALVTEGALVGSGDSSPMARIQQIDQVYVDVRRPASSLESLREALQRRKGASQSELPVAVLKSNGEAYDMKGRILFSGINVDTSTGDVLMRVLFNNPQRQLLPGMFVRVRVPNTSYSNALMVPQQAVVRVAGQSQVWTLDAKGNALRKPVELGELVERSYRVRSGLIAGQKIVVEGMARLTDGASVIALDWSSVDAKQSNAVAVTAH